MEQQLELNFYKLLLEHYHRLKLSKNKRQVKEVSLENDTSDGTPLPPIETPEKCMNLESTPDETDTKNLNEIKEISLEKDKNNATFLPQIEAPEKCLNLESVPDKANKNNLKATNEVTLETNNISFQIHVYSADQFLFQNTRILGFFSVLLFSQ